MPDFTFAPAPVLVEETGEFAIGATGVLRSTQDGQAVQMYDLNGSPLPSILVGPKGAHQAFKADIPNGVLDFGSVQVTKISDEAQVAALEAVTLSKATAATVAGIFAAGGGYPELVRHWNNPNVPRPAVPAGWELLWIGSVRPLNALNIDTWWNVAGAAAGGDTDPVVDANDPDAYAVPWLPDLSTADPDDYIVGSSTAAPNDPDAYIF